MVRGSCLCGGVKFECEPMDHLVHCHCEMCRRNSGSAFVTVVRCKADRFRWTAGEELIARYESSPGAYRTFCTVCGSKLPVIDGVIDGSEVLVLAGLLDEAFPVRSEAHWFVAHKAPWVDLPAGAQAFDEWPPEEKSP